MTVLTMYFSGRQSLFIIRIMSPIIKSVFTVRDICGLGDGIIYLLALVFRERRIS